MTYFACSCFVPGCDAAQSPSYDEPWVLHAVPGTHKGANTFVPEQCQRFEMSGNGTAATVCPADWFVEQQPIECDRWVFEKGERTIVNDV